MIGSPEDVLVDLLFMIESARNVEIGRFSTFFRHMIMN